MKWKQAILDYNHYLNIERGLSENTIDNYIRDVKKFVAFLEKKEVSNSPIQITEEFIQEFVYDISKKISPRSQARIISGLRSFFEYLIFENYRESNPTDLIEAPKIWTKITRHLIEEEINSLITAIDLSQTSRRKK